MNLMQANVIRERAGLAPIVKSAEQIAAKAAQKKRELANRAARAAQSQSIRDARNRNKK